MNTYEIIKELAKEKKISIRQLEISFGYSNGYLASWKRQNPNPYELSKLADYFNVSVDYLLGRTEERYPSKGELTNLDLDEILDNVKSFGGKPMTDRDRETLRAYLEGKFSDK